MLFAWFDPKSINQPTKSILDCGKSMAQIIYHLNLYLKGWWNYYRLTEARNIFKSLNGWIFRRLRGILWKQWKNPRTKVRNLLKHGISLKHAPSMLFWFGVEALHKMTGWARGVRPGMFAFFSDFWASGMKGAS
jgi:hypothetical protein